MAELTAALQRRIVQIEAFNPDDERLPLLRDQLAAEEGDTDFGSMKKAELLEAAEAAGLDVSESMTKAELVSALEG